MMLSLPKTDLSWFRPDAENSDKAALGTRHMCIYSVAERIWFQGDYRFGLKP